MVQWIAKLTRNVEVVASWVKGTRCFLEYETLPLLLSTGWFQEWIWTWCHNRTKTNIEVLMEDWLKCQITPLVKYRQNQNQNTPAIWYACTYNTYRTRYVLCQPRKLGPPCADSAVFKWWRDARASNLFGGTLWNMEITF